MDERRSDAWACWFRTALCRRAGVLARRPVVAAPLFVLSENLGWRAWLQRGLQVRHSPVVVGVVVGLVWTVWHLPLFEIDPLFAALPFVPFLLATVARSVLLAGLFNASRGSILPVAVAHFAFNIGTQLALPADAAAAGPLYVAMTVVSAVAAAVGPSPIRVEVEVTDRHCTTLACLLAFRHQVGDEAVDIVPVDARTRDARSGAAETCLPLASTRVRLWISLQVRIPTVDRWHRHASDHGFRHYLILLLTFR